MTYYVCCRHIQVVGFIILSIFFIIQHQSRHQRCLHLPRPPVPETRVPMLGQNASLLVDPSSAYADQDFLLIPMVFANVSLKWFSLIDAHEHDDSRKVFRKVSVTQSESRLWIKVFAFSRRLRYIVRALRYNKFLNWSCVYIMACFQTNIFLICRVTQL